MEWVLKSPQIHNTFGNLGFAHGDGYHVSETCNAGLESILHNILTEDKYLRTYRRSISFGQNINKDLIPLLTHIKEDKGLELLMRIFVNLTIPVECLFSVQMISKTDFGRHTIFEINNLLVSIKEAFTDNKVTKVITDFLNKNLEGDQNGKLSAEQCTNLNNSLLLLRNILHIPGDSSNRPAYTVQNQILWNVFSQCIDKVLIKLMIIPDAKHWSVTMVQLIALLYKDQHVVTLHKLLNLWLEASLSESSEDNESNTSPPNRETDDSSPMLTSDPTSDSSDTGGAGKRNVDPNSTNNNWNASSVANTCENGTSEKGSNANGTNANNLMLQPPEKNPIVSEKNRSLGSDTGDRINSELDKDKSSRNDCGSEQNKSDKKIVPSENSDCGYGTQIENQESISTSSNEEELPAKKPMHQKPHSAKQRINNKNRTGVSVQDRKRKKIVKRGKSNIINVQGLSHKTPTDEDISNVLKEFTVDFLLKGYNSLVQTLHSQILTNVHLEIDTSHFFWLITYFLKFATQIELDLENVSSVLSYEIVSYLTAEGVNLCEQFELAIKLDENELKPCIRRLHLVVTAIREFVQAIEVYKKNSYIRKEDQEVLVKLQIKMCETEELRSLLVLLLRHYNPKYHTKQYLQDLVVTNHILLMFLDNFMKLPEYNGSAKMNEHIKQFATPELMYQYGLLLEDYLDNGEFVNDCIFTLMHHVGGELDSLICLFQPKILQTFTSIWKSEFEICDDWSDLIEYVINTFIKKPCTLQRPTNFRLDNENFEDEKPQSSHHQQTNKVYEGNEKKGAGVNHSLKDKWTEDELSFLNWNYMQCNTYADVIGEIVKLFKEDGIHKSRDAIIRELMKQNLINNEDYESLTKRESDTNAKTMQMNKKMRDGEIGKLCEQLTQDGKYKSLEWVQKVLLDICYIKIYLKKKSINSANNESAPYKSEFNIFSLEFFTKKTNLLPVMSPVSYHSLVYNKSVPLVPWNCEQSSICKDLKFLQLLHKLGFHMPVDTGKVFIRIPHFWTADYLYDVAGKLFPIDISQLKFSINDISDNTIAASTQLNDFAFSSDSTKDTIMISTHDNVYQINKQKHASAMVNFTPMPTSSYNLEEGENKNNNWLELVQKSQDCNMILRSESAELDLDGDIVMLAAKPEGPIPPAVLGAKTIAEVAALVLPTVMSVQQGTSHFDVHQEFECTNNSVYETASVASDLTRMYVSDEDEKPDIPFFRT